MRHPAQAALALFAGGDLGWLEQWRVRSHTARCAACRDEIARFQQAFATLVYRAGEPPPALHWSGLAEEMRANIRLGVDAGALVAPPESRQEPLGWRSAAALAALTLVIVSGWWLYIPRMQRTLAPDTGVSVAVKGDGVELTDGAGTLMLMHPKSADPGDVTVSVEADGAARARYVDEQSGQVTINNVYAE